MISPLLLLILSLLIRVARYGELALECVTSYYKYGCALLYKAQEEADPLATVPKKEDGGQASDKDGTIKETQNGESSVASVSSNVRGDGSSHDEDGAVEDGIFFPRTLQRTYYTMLFLYIGPNGQCLCCGSCFLRCILIVHLEQ